MKKAVKRTLVVLAVAVGAVVLAWGAMLLKLNHETRDFTPLETGHLMPGLGVVRDGISNVYILRDTVGYVVVDCGNSAKNVAAQMKTLGVDPAEVTAVLLTHSDSDHVGALGLFPHATLYMAREEVQMTDGTTPKFMWFGNSLPRTDYVLLDDREVIDIDGLRVEGILAPGHTSGMMAFLVNDKYLFTGDVVSLADGKTAPIPAFFDMDREQALASIDTIRNLPTAKYILTGHWGWADYKTATE